MENNKTEEHRCEICNDIIDEEWLDGDYSLLVCRKTECLDASQEVHDIAFALKYWVSSKQMKDKKKIKERAEKIAELIERGKLKFEPVFVNGKMISIDLVRTNKRESKL